MKLSAINTIAIIIFTLSASGQNNWHDVGGGVPVPSISTMAVDTANHLLYIAGTFETAGTIVAHQVVTWNGNLFAPVDCPNGLSFELFGPVQAGAFINNKFVCGGLATMVNSGCPSAPIVQIFTKMQFDGNHWDSVGTNWPGYINCITSFQGNIVFGGSIGNVNMYTTNQNANNITIWNSNQNQWQVLGASGNFGVTWPSGNAEVIDAIEFNGELFVSGIFSHAGGTMLSNFGIARWDGNNWNNAGMLPVSFGHFTIYNSELYLAEYGGSSIYKWASNDWQLFAQIPAIPGNSVTDIIEWDGKLVITGVFTSVNGVTANNIAIWDGLQWSNLGTGLSCLNCSVVYGTVLSYLDGSLYVAGSFDRAGSTIVNGLARWGPTVEINELLIDKINIQPNPVNQYLQLEGDLSLFEKLTITGIDGKIIFAANVQQKSDISFLGDGIYILQLTTREGLILSKKFVVQN